MKNSAGELTYIRNAILSQDLTARTQNNLLTQHITVDLSKVKKLENAWSTKGNRIECSYSMKVVPCLSSVLHRFCESPDLEILVNIIPGASKIVKLHKPSHWCPTLMPSVFLNASAPPLDY